LAQSTRRQLKLARTLFPIGCGQKTGWQLTQKSAVPKQKSSSSSLTLPVSGIAKSISRKRRECRVIGASYLAAKQKEL
jgi:hypothetical protein